MAIHDHCIMYIGKAMHLFWIRDRNKLYQNIFTENNIYG